jgi:hypothetical protein
MESMSVLLKKKSLDHRVDIEGHHRNVKYQSFAKYSTLNVVASTKYTIPASNAMCFKNKYVRKA